MLEQHSTSLVKRSKNYNVMVSSRNIRIRFLVFLLFDVNFSVLFLRDEFVLTIFSKLLDLKKYVLVFEIYKPSSNLSLTKFLVEKGEEKSNFLTDYKRSYFLNFSFVLSAKMY